MEAPNDPLEGFYSRNDEALRSNASHEGKEATPFRLLDLPPEVWIRICSFAVTNARPILLHEKYFKVHVEHLTRQPNITRVSKQLRAETLPLFYSNNFFVLHLFGHMVPIWHRWLHAIGRRNRRHLTNLWLAFVLGNGPQRVQYGGFLPAAEYQAEVPPVPLFEEGVRHRHTHRVLLCEDPA
ncbi:hypothetical protein LTR85_008327 [Meristemomyces frigidus]|nr:hypothetical protein LTR85_008327 [Meristemomyces frigidus]